MSFESFVYVLIEREFITSQQNVYKIGKTKDIIQRFKNYPKGSKLLCLSMCNDHHKSETNLKNVFKQNFIHRQDIGQEYFEGDLYDVIDTFHKHYEIRECTSLSHVESHTLQDVPKNNQFNSKHKVNREYVCDFCHRGLSSSRRLMEHKEKCLLKNDRVRLLEIQLNKSVVLDFKSTVCRFCGKDFRRMDSLHRHDTICKDKKIYEKMLQSDIEKNSPRMNITINNFNTISDQLNSGVSAETSILESTRDNDDNTC